MLVSSGLVRMGGLVVGLMGGLVLGACGADVGEERESAPVTTGTANPDDPVNPADFTEGADPEAAAGTDESPEAGESAEDGADGDATLVMVGEEFSCQLESNPGTGYSWQLQEIDEAVLRLNSQTSVGPEEGRLGAPGYERFVFVGVGPGSQTLVLHYMRVWETGVDPLEVHELRVVVSQ